jgi:hypothetical protein
MNKSAPTPLKQSRVDELLGKAKHSQLLIQALWRWLLPAAPAESILPHLEMTTDDTVPVAAAYASGNRREELTLRSKALSKKDPFLHMVASWALASCIPRSATHEGSRR